MFNKGRPKKHAHIAFFTYKAPDGSIISYEMSNKGLLKKIPNSPKITLQNTSKISTEEKQTEIPLTDIQLNYLKDQLSSLHHSFSNQDLNSQNLNNELNYMEEQNIPDMINTDFLLDNNPFDEDFFNCETFLNDETKIENTPDNEYFCGLSDFPNTEFKSNIDEDFF